MLNRCACFSSFKISLPFAAFTFWLLAFPMAGPLQIPDRLSTPLLVFLVPHILTMLWLALCFPRRHQHLERITVGCCLLACIAPLLYWLFPSLSFIALVLAGIGGGGFVVRSGALLGQADKPIKAAGWGLITANLLLIAIINLPLAHGFKFCLTAAIPLVPLLHALPPQKTASLRPLWNYLPYVLLYHVISGLLYGYLLPLYQDQAWLNGFEPFIYCLFVVVAAILFRKKPVAVLFSGFTCALITCWFIYVPAVPAVNLGMWMVQAAAGFIDLFLVALLATQTNQGQSFALGCAVLCSGVLGGVFFAEIFGAQSRFLVFSESLVLNFAAMAFFIFKRPLPPAGNNADTGIAVVPPEIVRLLSERENEALCAVLQGLPYREVARGMEISESTVKTYMNRIYQKTETWGKKALLKYIKEVKKKEI